MIFSTCKIPELLNQTYIALISKIAQATYVKDYRPISLCNTTYKVISKILATRIKKFTKFNHSRAVSFFTPEKNYW